ncbi:MAG: histidine phosphatase family protein [Caldilineaceae bacterium]
MSLDQHLCTIYLVRHAESEVNAQVGVPTQYGSGGSPLSQRGRQQAADLARHFHHLTIAQVYASERLRAQETAQILAAGQPITIAPRLHERPDPAGAEPESDADAVARITAALNAIARNHPGETVVAVSHGYIMRTLLVALGFATFDELPKDALTHTGYMQLLSDGERLALVEVVGVQKTGGK